jgi:hypothetical protein
MSAAHVAGLSPEQRTACAELLSRGTGINCFEEAALLLDTIETLVDGDKIRAIDLIRWLTLLPRVKDRAAALAQAPMPNPAQLALVTPVSDLPATMQHAMRPVAGADRRRSAEWLTNPEAGPSSVKRIGRPATGICRDCDAEFPMNPFGRPATRCEAHRRPASPPRQQESA